MPFDQFTRVHELNPGAYFVLPMILNLLLISTTALIGVLLYRRFSGSKFAPGQALPQQEHPEDILKRRFAEGLISKEDFEERMTTLVGRTHHPL